MLMSIPVFLLMLSLCILVHEYGHFFTAKRLGMPVLQLSIGMGPKLLHLGELQGVPVYLRAIPIGGFVLFGKEFLEQPPTRKIAVILAGPAFSLAFGVLVPILAGLTVGPAAVSAVWQAIVASITDFFGLLAPSQLSHFSANTSSLIGVYHVSQPFISHGIKTTALFTGIFSINIGLMNLVPIPALDGGRIAVYLVEWLRGGKRLPLAVEGGLALAGIAVVLRIVCDGLVNDVFR